MYGKQCILYSQRREAGWKLSEVVTTAANNSRSLAETKGEVNMSKTKLQAMVEALVSLREMAAELADEIDTLQDAIKADMEKQGVDVLEDIAIVGYDNIDLCAAATPPLTSVVYKTYDVGKMAARVLGKLLDGKPSDGFAYYLMQPEIVERASSPHKIA